jgi:hypothetical protein
MIPVKFQRSFSLVYIITCMLVYNKFILFISRTNYSIEQASLEVTF